MSTVRLRYSIDLNVTQENGEYVVVLRCKEGLSPSGLALRGVALNVIQYLNGAHTEEEIKKLVIEKTGFEGLTEDVLKILDEALFLENSNSAHARNAIRNTFNNQTIREAQFAGGIYPTDSESRKQYVQRVLDTSHIITASTDSPSLIITPHIDYRRGEMTYGRTFKSAGDLNWDVSILIGTNHQPSDELFALTKKNFSLPGHVFKTEEEAVNRIAAKTGDWVFRDEFCHKAEHSLELQLPYLETLLPNTSLIPIIVCGFYNFLTSGALPASDKKYNDFVDALAAEISNFESQGKKVGILAGVDMAHIGKNFGDTKDLSDEWLEEIQILDQEYLACIESSNLNSLFAHMAKDQDARRMCGFPTLYTVLDLYQRLNKKIWIKTIDYRQAVDYGTQTCVTFSGALGYDGV